MSIELGTVPGHAAPLAPKAPSPTPRTRRPNCVAVLRGIVLILMVLDHTRDYFGNAAINPTDLSEVVESAFPRQDRAPPRGICWARHLPAAAWESSTATDTVLGREVAVTVLQERHAPDSSMARRFADEATAAQTGRKTRPGTEAGVTTADTSGNVPKSWGKIWR